MKTEDIGPVIELLAELRDLKRKAANLKRMMEKPEETDCTDFGYSHLPASDITELATTHLVVAMRNIDRIINQLSNLGVTI